MGNRDAATIDLAAFPLSPKTRRFLTETRLGHLIDGQIVEPAGGSPLQTVDET